MGRIANKIIPTDKENKNTDNENRQCSPWGHNYKKSLSVGKRLISPSPPLPPALAKIYFQRPMGEEPLLFNSHTKQETADKIFPMDM